MSNLEDNEQPHNTKSRSGTDEANLVWDEYKYRHDLIWRHLIRSTVAVVTLVTVAYSTAFEDDPLLFIVAALLAVAYTVFSFIVLNSELALYEKIKVLHRQRQNRLYDLHTEKEPFPDEEALVGGFSSRARFYLLGLLALAVAVAAIHIW